ncbi:MAG TPA: flagellar motor protein MotD [Azonexus sp.]|jgi:chemotaxis protein MotB|nr:flagellar motor protein MotD [Azonexus sp.]
MRRRRKYLDQRQSDNHERWLVSYADFITLLFAFFVVMYALSTVSEGKYRVLSESLGSAFGGSAPERIPSALAPQEPQVQEPQVHEPPPQEPQVQEPTLREDVQPAFETVKPAELPGIQREQMRGIAQDILKILDSLVRDGQVKVTQSNRGISVEINASVLFASGQAQLRPESGRALQQVAKVLAPTGQGIQVEGYTDDVPISTALFPSNWELSAARASSVVRLFSENGVAEQRLSVIGYGPNRPATGNETPEGRARNRRVTVMILAETPGKVIDIPLEGATPLQ